MNNTIIHVKKKKIWNVLIMNHKIIFFKLLEIWKEKKEQQQCNKTTIDQCMDKNFLVGLAINVNCKIKECPCKNRGGLYELFQKDTASCKLGCTLTDIQSVGPHYNTVTI